MPLPLDPIAAEFGLKGRVLGAVPHGSGHINDTFCVHCEDGGRPVRYILQRINHHIFHDVPALMDNVCRVTRHLRARFEREGLEDAQRRTPTLVPTRDGQPYLKSPHGEYWRVYEFIEGAQTHDLIRDPAQAREAARAFGQFQRGLADLPEPRLNETIPRFHHTRSRYDALEHAIAADVCGRAEAVAEEIAFARRREATSDVLLDLQASGELPERVTHNDTKINNVMMDERTGRSLCVVDLDTTMPGLALYDFGDLVRTAASTGAEDERDLSRIALDLELFEALASGYLEVLRDTLTAAEIAMLPFSARLIAFEIGIRFLTDHLAGDPYFKVHRDGHNLDRARAQFKLLTSIERQEDEMRRIVDRLARRR